MMNNKENQVTCGDTEFCEECGILEATKDETGKSSATFTKNDKGHCDFYDGPDKVVVKVAPR